MSMALCGFSDCDLGEGRDRLIINGPTLFVNVGFDPDYDASRHEQMPNLPTEILALIDTGATESCIDADLAISLGLQVFDRREVAGSGGSYEVDMYLVQMHVPALYHVVTGLFAGVRLRAGNPAFHRAILGRTFLREFIMTYDGTSGTVKIEKP